MPAKTLDARSASVEASPKRQRAKRLPASARKAVILAAASEFFARHGFGASTRDLADQIGVRQALLYKYYASKEALIDAVFDSMLAERDMGDFGKLSADRSKPLADRIFNFHRFLAGTQQGCGTHLVMRAALDDLPVMKRLASFTTRGFFFPLIAELRELEGLPTTTARPVMDGELEIMLGLHASAMFVSLRRNTSNQTAPSSVDDSLRLLIAAFLPGARLCLRQLHAGEWPTTLTGDAASAGV